MSIEEFRAENAAIARAHNATEQLQRRQQPNDDGFTDDTYRFTTPRDGSRTQVSNILTGNAQFSAEEAETYTFGVTASVEIGGDLFGTMTAGAGISVDTSVSYTNAKTETINLSCEGQCGVVDYIHLYDCYEGRFTPSGDSGEFCVPIDSGVYQGRCIGCPTGAI